MSWHLTGLVSKRLIGSTARKLLLLSMADKANDDGSGVWASYETLATMCESSRATVKRLVHQFIAEGLLVLVDARKGRTNEFSLVIEAIEALPKVVDEVTKKRLAKASDPGHHDPGHHGPGSPRPGYPGHHDPTTRVTMTPEPILKPILKPTQSAPARRAEGAVASKPLAKPKTFSMQDDWTPNEDTCAYGRRLGFADWEIAAAASDCRDYWLDRPGERRAGWEATFKRRLRDILDDPRKRKQLKLVSPAADPSGGDAQRRTRCMQLVFDGYWEKSWGPRPQRPEEGGEEWARWSAYAQTGDLKLLEGSPLLAAIANGHDHHRAAA